VKILIADDDPISRRLVQASIAAAGYEVVVAVDGLEALAQLEKRDSPRLAVLDWMMPRLDGLKVCEAIRKRASDADAYVYIILLTSNEKREQVVRGLESGADDYLTKPFDVDELKARIRAGRRILDLQDQLVSARDNLHVQATHDALTGIWNRRAILELLQSELSRSKRVRTPLAVIMADLDHFKRINDTYGHPAGDVVLCEASRRMTQNLRVYDAMGRYGGEEFLIVAPGCGKAEATHVADRLREAMCETPFNLGPTPQFVTVSLGVAAAEPGTDMESLLGSADKALYEAKHNGRNIVSVSPAG
jgi:two-component system cell cycle response regulator